MDMSLEEISIYRCGLSTQEIGFLVKVSKMVRIVLLHLSL